MGDWLRGALVIGIVVVMLAALPGATSLLHPTPSGALPASSPSSEARTAPVGEKAPTAPTAPSAPTPGAASSSVRAQSILSTLHRDGVPSRFIHLPNLAAEGNPGRQVGLTYPAAPAPMGVSDIGLRNVSGSLVPYELNTSSAEGKITFTDAQSLYVDGDGPDMFGVQLNSVATNVTLFGNSTYQFWTQNFVSYTSSSGELSFGDNVWNFSDSQGLISQNVFYETGPNGTLVAPVYYYAVGPTFTVHYPFTVQFFLNATVLDDRPAVFFNYSVTSATVNTAGSFDFVVFNSSLGAPSGPAPAPRFQIDGYQTDPIGLDNDIELVVVGNDDGDTTTFYQMQAALSIAYWNSTRGAYAAVPSAFDTGADTGETSNGVYVYYTAPGGVVSPVANMVIGPSFLVGLWNVSTSAGVRTFHETQSPANAFLWVTPGTAFNRSTAQWVPTIPIGAATSNFGIPNDGSPYFFEWMLSDYRAVGATYNPGANSTTALTRTLVHSNAAGVYTPLFAWGNGELAAISSAGAGTSASPYQLVNNQVQSIDSVFSQWNDFQFPVFPGILLVNTTAWVSAVPPSFAIDYPPGFSTISYAPGLPDSNNLQLDFDRVSNVSLVNATAISGWSSYEIPNVYPYGDVIFWNSSGNLIANNTFYDQGSALVLYGGTNNTVWGNSFLETPVASVDPSSLFQDGNTSGVYESESGDLLYNNYFNVTTPAYSPTFDPLLCQIECEGASYVDAWNVSLQPANATATVLGENLTGSILGTWYQGGNYWSNYGVPPNPFGSFPLVPPYNDSGWITNGGDSLPLVAFSVYNVTFTEVGLPAGTSWNLQVNGTSEASSSPNIVFWLPNGTDYAVDSIPPTGYADAMNGTITFSVTGGPNYIGVYFYPLLPVTFTERGLVPGWTWAVAAYSGLQPVDNYTTSSNATAVLELPGSTTSTTIAGYATALGYSTVAWSSEISLAPINVSIDFTALTALTFIERGLPSGAAWQVSLQQEGWETSKISTGPTLAFTTQEVAPGPLTFNVSATNYTASPSRGTYFVPGTGGVTIDFSPVNGSLSVRVVQKTATFSVDGTTIPLTATGLAVVNLPPGLHSVEASLSGYLPFFDNVSVASNQTTSLTITLVSIPSAPAPTISPVAWAAIGLLAAVAVILGLLALAYRSRGRRPPPKPIAPASAPATTTTKPDWSESSSPGK